MEKTYLCYEGKVIDTVSTKMDLRKIVKIKITSTDVVIVGVDGFSAVPSSTMQEALRLLCNEIPKGAHVCNGYNY